MLNLDQLKALFEKGMHYAVDNFSSPLYSNHRQACLYQVSLAKNAKNLTTFMTAVSALNQVFQSSFKTPDKICAGCELTKTGIQFGIANKGWYFLWGKTNDFVYNINFRRQELASSDIVDVEPSEAVRWTIGGGYGKVGGEWYNLQYEWIYMKYEQDTSNNTFFLAGNGNTMSVLMGCRTPMQFYFDISFTDTKGQQHRIASTLTAKTPPAPNSPDACNCGDCVGSLYYSFTDMGMTITVNNQTSSGNGWIDHQLIKGGPPCSLYLQAITTVTNMISGAINPGWFWTVIVDNETNTQYMLSYFPVTKTFNDFVSQNKALEFSNKAFTAVNVYKNGLAKFHPEDGDYNYKNTKLVILKTMVVNCTTLPTEYHVTLPSGKKGILSLASGPNVYSDIVASYENPSIFYTEDRSRVIGSGIIEANLYMDTKEIAKRAVIGSGGIPNDHNIGLFHDVLIMRQNAWQKTLAVFVLLLPLFILILGLLYIFMRKDNRHVRFTVFLIVVVICYVLLNRPLTI